MVDSETSDPETPGLYIQLISIHGLIRSLEPELGRDADTGGQVKYVLELARALAARPEVGRVDLLTRKVEDEKVDADYSRECEELCENAYLVRLPCGPRRYIRKELLWPHLDDFADEVLKYLRRVRKIPDVIHSHYADAGYVGSLLSGYLGVPLVHTGHSLGRVKRMRLMEKGVSAESIERQYRMRARIEAEETALDNAACVIASTQQEVDDQYSLYDDYAPSRMRVIPPGVDLDRFHPPARFSAKPAIQQQVDRFLENPGKPPILTLCRPDPRKNVSTLIHAYGEHSELRKLANLVIVLGNRETIKGMDRESRAVLEEVIHLIDDYDLHGSVAYPKHHDPDDVPDLYRLVAQRKGVFVNPALTEPFGLTLIEAAASGLPIVATNDGGPQDIVKNCKNGALVDPLDRAALGSALYDALTDRQRWRQWARRGIRGAHRFYSWTGHASLYLREISKLLAKATKRRPTSEYRNRLPIAECLLITDIDNTLIGEEESLRELLQLLADQDLRVGLGVATGRSLESARRILGKWRVPDPDVWMTSVGTEIHYGSQLTHDGAWERHIDYRWNPEEIRATLAAIPGLKLQPSEHQRKHKISYFAQPKKMPAVRDILRTLRQHQLAAKVVYSHEAYLDVLPVRASKGKALRHLAMKWDLAIDRILVAGDSGNDEEMLRGETLAVVVGNHSAELGKLRGQPNIYFASAPYASGIVEAIEHYRFFRSDNDHDPHGAEATRPTDETEAEREDELESTL